MSEPVFVPKPGQVNYKDIRYAPVINTVVTDGTKYLLVRRSATMRLYPGCWSGISGFLDDNGSIEDKVYEELSEEVGIAAENVVSITRGRPLLQEAPEYHKTWLVVPVLVKIKAVKTNINWESEQASWFEISELTKLDLLPGYMAILEEFISL